MAAGTVLGLGAVLLMACVGTPVMAQPNYVIGTGIYDVTGPAADINMMGYAEPAQRSAGLHLRQYSRAFILGPADDSRRVVYVSVDVGMMTQNVKREVVRQLRQRYLGRYTDENVLLSATHTHSGPAGFHQYVLYEVTSLGFVRESFDALVQGITKSIELAHNNVRPGYMYINHGELLHANINRSPQSYLNNPAEERARYQYNVDKTMTVVKLTDADHNGIGMINWFPVHCTSMNKSNQLISSDNKGYASLLFEAQMNAGRLPGRGPFVAAFGQANEGDVSPNTAGPHCTDTGLACDTSTSTCGDDVQKCIASGPGQDQFESTKIIGRLQFDKAWELYNSPSVQVQGPVDVRLQYVDMSQQEVVLNSTTTVQTCKPAMGYSFAAGTTDGPGAFGFSQGDTSGNPMWDVLRNLIKKPSQSLIDCHHPKPILLATGEMQFPYEWQPHIVDTQVLRVGQLFILGVPGEFSTMSGRRLRDSVTQSVKSAGFDSEPEVVVAGLSNSYSSYITTPEEYQVQRYEGASTIYGPHTLPAYTQRFSQLARALIKGEPVDRGQLPPDLMSKQISFVTPVVFDHAPIFKHFGDVISNAKASYIQGERVSVTFISANPRNNRQTNGTFLAVERQAAGGGWDAVAWDSAWETQFHWRRPSALSAESEALITWDIPANQIAGTYRMRHFGTSKNLFGHLRPFTGTSQTFQVIHA